MSDRRRVNAPLVQSYRRTDPPGCGAGARARRGPVAAALELSQAVSGVEARGADVRHVPNVRLCAASTCWRPISDGERRKPFGRFEDQLGHRPLPLQDWDRTEAGVGARASHGGDCVRRTRVVHDSDSDLARRVRKWVEETTRAQGLSVHVTDPVALRRIAEILWPEEPSASPRRSRNPRPTQSSASERQALRTVAHPNVRRVVGRRRTADVYG